MPLTSDSMSNLCVAVEVSASRVVRRVGVPKTLVMLENAIAVSRKADFILTRFGGKGG